MEGPEALILEAARDALRAAQEQDLTALKAAHDANMAAIGAERDAQVSWGSDVVCGRPLVSKRMSCNTVQTGPKTHVMYLNSMLCCVSL